ncbi:MAG: hypothetical protein OXH99_18900 [Bryobacterales bacterium]|nr:hypothetical protein [Bryobacterales bacterium]
MSNPLVDTAFSTAADVFKQVLSSMQGKWIRRTIVATEVVQVLRTTPRRRAAPDVALKLHDALTLAHSLIEQPEDLDKKLKDLNNMLEDIAPAIALAKKELEVVEGHVQNAQETTKPEDKEAHLKVALSAIRDPALAAAEAALIRHLNELHERD